MNKKRNNVLYCTVYVMLKLQKPTWALMILICFFWDGWKLAHPRTSNGRIEPTEYTPAYLKHQPYAF